jgi:hypothetical protein
MDVIGHQAECVDSVCVTFLTLLDQAMKSQIILIFPENILPCVSTQDHMIDRPGEMNARFASHEK